MPDTYARRRQQEHKNLGLCISCSQPAVVGRTRCETHLAADRKRQTQPDVREKKKEYFRSAHAQEINRNSQYERHYGITLEQYEVMLSSQDGCCAICGEEPGKKNGRVNRLCVDHDHKTDQVRGLLCITCNAAIGMLKDDEDVAHRAVTYLQFWSSQIS